MLVGQQRVADRSRRTVQKPARGLAVVARWSASGRCPQQRKMSRIASCSAEKRRSRSSVSGRRWPALGRRPRNARRALRITATSIASCSSAPSAGGRSRTRRIPSPPATSAIPMAALCTAIRRERRAITIASASRSSRSVVSTMSAASELAVEPRTPIAMPTSAAARAGASLTPSPTMAVTAARARRAPPRPSRQASAARVPRRGRAPNRSVARALVGHRSASPAGHSGGAQSANGPRRILSQWIHEDYCARKASVDTHPGNHRPVECRA